MSVTKMCKAYKEIRKGNPNKYIEMVGDGRYICKKCGRTAASKKYLCCPMEIKPGEEISPEELATCSLRSCKGGKRKSKKVKKMKEDDLRKIVREEVYDAIKKVVEEIRE